jgi:hypothetical protein
MSASAAVSLSVTSRPHAAASADTPRAARNQRISGARLPTADAGPPDGGLSPPSASGQRAYGSSSNCPQRTCRPGHAAASRDTRPVRTCHLRIKSPCSDIPVQISADCCVHFIPFHSDSSPRLYRPTPRHTTPSRAARSHAARHRVPGVRANRRAIDAVDLLSIRETKPLALWIRQRRPRTLTRGIVRRTARSRHTWIEPSNRSSSSG